ncbi:MAG: DNRLRE domain-containing protein, partial [Phycisphaerales bacterium]|nr:DNRLRE domain-containing protein [Phycisphaerales bacterium]
MSTAKCDETGGTFVGGGFCVSGASTRVVSVNPNADTWLQESAPTTAHGNSTSLWAGEQGSSNRLHILMDFDISEEVLGAGEVLSATLDLDYEQFQGSPSSVTFARLTQTWTSAEATWNTSNGLTAWMGGGGAVGAVDFVTPLSFDFTVGDEFDDVLDVTSFVEDAVVNRDGLLSVAIIKTVPDGFNSRSAFASLESGTGFAPLLQIVVSEGLNPCIGSCCLGTGICEELSNETCIDYGGVFIFGEYCSSEPCGAACCLPQGGCEETSSATCADFGGTYLGTGSSCTECIATGICCFSSGSCVETYSESSCFDLGGSEFVEGESCEEDACLLLGACCFKIGGCEEISRDSCLEFDGNYLGLGTSCADGCGDTGACCLFDGTNRAWLNELHYDDLPRMWVNELHYDDEGVDFQEFLEIALESTVDPVDVNVYLYDGESGLVYDSMSVDSFELGNLSGGMSLYYEIHILDGDITLQDGRPDGLALTYQDGGSEQVIQFLSYEGTFTANDGPASGLTSEDIGVNEEPPPSNIDTSIGLTQSGAFYDDFRWTNFSTGLATPGAVNGSQSINENGNSIHELIEVALDSAIQPEDARVVLYDGEDGLMYGEYSIDTFAQGEEEGGMTIYARTFSNDAIQDGGSDGDGIAVVVSVGGIDQVKNFVSYEGSFVASNGPANGMQSLEIDQNVINSQTTNVGSSIGLIGNGRGASEFAWANFDVNSSTLVNDGQKLLELGEGDYSGCMELTEIGCYSIDGTYNGDDVSCGVVPCETMIRGACCFETGGCANISEDGCSYIGGIWSGAGTSCEDASSPCAAEGACCLPSGTCMNLSQETCESIEDSVYYDGESCDTVDCVVTGSCCLDFGICLDSVSETTCTFQLNGDYRPDSCQAEDCFKSGACCFESGSCIQVRDSFGCEDLGGDYKGDGSECEDNPCSGACCLSTGACHDTKTEEDCTNLGGDFLASSFCADRPCVGACCIDRENCDRVSQSTCESTLDGTFMGFLTDCSVDDPCNQGAYGACCINEGDYCMDDLSEAACDSFGGVHFPDKACSELGLGECETVGEANGACCLSDNTCAMVSGEGECSSFGGDYAGDGTECSAFACTGPCCIKSGSCVDTNQAECEDDLGGQFLGTGASCQSNPCRGACCLDSGSCIDVEMFATCTDIGGEFLSFGSVCSTDPCGGACCLENLGCEYVSGPTCTEELLGSFLGRGTTCVSEPCVEGSCCLGSGSCLETFQSTCDFYGGTFFSGVLCDTDPCLGACCLWSGGCEMVSIDTCSSMWDPDGNGLWAQENPPGMFSDFGQSCDDVSCDPIGSCCMPSGSCIDIKVEITDGSQSDFFYFCEEVIGGSFEPGEFCVDRECVGACCLFEGGCEDLPAQTCESIGGVFTSVGTLCSDNPCVEGACCFDSGSCNYITQEVCELNQGEWSGEGVDCEDITCQAYFLVTNK